jgi:hypothetical protein
MGPSLRPLVWAAAVLGVLCLWPEVAGLPGGPAVAQAAKRWNKKVAKRKPVRAVRGSAKRAGGTVFPPLRGGVGEPGSLVTAAPSGPAPAADPANVAPVTVTSKTAAPPPAAPAAKALSAGPLPKRKKGPPSDEELMEDAQAAYVRGDRGKAIELALVVAEKSSERSPAAWKFIGLAACSVRSHRLATRAYQGVRTPYDQRAIADACKYNGLSYKGDQFVGE